MIESAAYDLLKELAWDEAWKAGSEEGKKEGIEEGIQRSIRKMLMRGFKPDDVAAILDVDMKSVKQIVDSLTTPVN